MAYPHFLHTGSVFPYLYKSPLGLIPCPTLSFVTGMALILNNLRSRGWYITVIVAGLFYGFTGVFRLGVTIDLILIIAAVLLTIKMLVNLRR
jgi:hypothetical protein